jgi:enoyl-CoA hydratase
MQLQNMTWRLEGGVGVATFNRPKALNALNAATIAELGGLLDEVARDPAVRALVLTGAGDKAFVAGADVSEMAALSPLAARRFAEAGQKTFAKLEALPIPTLAAVNGFALGGGCELAMACDLVYASETARFGQPEVNLGIMPGFGGTQRLVRRVGLMRAKELVLTGDLIDAAKAKEIGLALEVVPAGDLLAYALDKARRIASRAPAGVAHSKRVLEAGAGVDLATGCALELDSFALLLSTDDAREGMRAFLEKRAASFKGS